MQVNNVHDIDVVMPMYNLIEHFILLRYCRQEPALDVRNAITGFTEDNITNLFKSKEKIKGKIRNNGRKDVEIFVLLKYLINFWKNLEIPLINCEFKI